MSEQTLLTNRARPRSDRKGRRTIAFFNQQIGAEWTLRPWWGAADAAQKHGVNLISCIGNTLAWPFNFEEQGNVVYQLVKSHRLDGLVIWKAALVMGQTEQEVERFCRSYGVPVVTIEGALAGSPCVSYRNDLGQKEMVEHLIEVHGFQRIGFLGLNEDHIGFRTRHQAYVDALTAHGIPIDPALSRAWLPSEDITGSPARDSVVIDYLRGALNAGAQALIGASDVLAIQMMRLLQEQGINVPRDVAVVGFDSFNESRSVTPPLTSVQPAWYDLGYLAVENLLRLMDGQPVDPLTTVSHQLKVRQSCGCLDASVAAAGSNPKFKRPARAAGASAANLNPEHAVKAMAEAFGSLSQADLTQSLEQLAWAFFNSITQPQSGAFLSKLDDFLRQMMAVNVEFSACQDALTALRQAVLPHLAASEAASAETLLQQARILIGRTAERAQAYQRLQADARADRLRSVGQALITTFDIDQLMTVLAEQLPALGIPSGYVALFDDAQRYHYPEPAPQYSRLMLAFDKNERKALPPGGLRYETCEILPDGYWPEDESCSFITQSLYFQDHLIGFMMLETGQREGNIYEALRGQISSALQGSTLVKRVENRAVQLQTAAEVSQAASSLLDSDELSRQVVQVVRERFNLYYAGLFLLDNSKRWAVLRAGTGEAGQRMLVEGHKLEVGGQSTVGSCIAQKRALIAHGAGASEAHFNNPMLPDTRSEMVLPLISRGEAMGALTVQSAQEQAFNEEDTTVLQTMADQVANAISNAQLFEQAEQRARELARAKELADNARLEAEKARLEAEKARREAEAEKESAEKAQLEAEQARKATETANQQLARQMWQTNGQAMLNERMRGEQDITMLGNNVIQQLCKYLDVQAGALYLAEGSSLMLTCAYAFRRKGFPQTVRLGESQVGQSAFEKQMILTAIPDEYVTAIYNASGELLPKFILTAPLVYNDQLIGAIEMQAMVSFTSEQMEFLNKALESIVVAFTTALARKRVNELLAETRQQAEELQAQEEELRSANEELEAQTETLRASEAKLKRANVELEEKAAALQESSQELKQKQAILDQQNHELRLAQQSLEQKAADLALASKYKSEFLANMSHELRTPLNSLLILANMLARNEEGNLTPEQVESAQIIYSGGTDLLNLINEILDLSKVEAGKMEFRSAPVSLEQLAGAMRAQFNPVAENKNLEFEIRLGKGLPETIDTDRQRVEQILKNLLSNAFKFTAEGSVRVDFFRPDARTDLSKSGLNPSQAIALRVTDTGIGMTPDQQKIVFEAFQQADGSTSRQYGGTGLGLAISRELAGRLGGQIDLTSEVSKGSAFTLYLPLKRAPEVKAVSPAKAAPRNGKGDPAARAEIRIPRPTTPSEAPKTVAVAAMVTADSAEPPAEIPQPMPAPLDDSADIQPGDRVLLVIEDDLNFARLVFSYAHKKNFKCVLAQSGEAGLRTVRARKVDGIILDLSLPGMNGWEVLDTLKDDPDTRHIPIHVMSAADEDISAYQRGAIGFLSKPISQAGFDSAFQQIERFIAKSIKSLLLVEDDETLRQSVRKLLEGNDVQITEAGRGAAALDLLSARRYDCMILDLTLPDMSGFDLLNRLNDDQNLHRCPVIVYTGKELTEEENNELIKYADSVIIKGAKSPERLIDETALFLHRVIASMPEEKQHTIKQLHDKDALFAGKEILIVDDDARNAFALSKLLSSKGLKVYIAPTGQKALEMLEKTPIKLVLMDIMLPGMDGYEVTRRIRATQRFHHLPILALTAKAMKGDREKCLSAGANDYLSKPIDPERLFSMMRVWLSKEHNN